jgi:hypothetical protein
MIVSGYHSGRFWLMIYDFYVPTAVEHHDDTTSVAGPPSQYSYIFYINII